MAHGRLIRVTAVLFSLCKCLLCAQARLLNLSGDPTTLFNAIHPVLLRVVTSEGLVVDVCKWLTIAFEMLVD